jgi:hypothetical protein
MAIDGERSATQFEILAGRCQQIEVFGKTYWRVEGDYLYDRDQLMVYSQQWEAIQTQRQASRAAAAAGLGDVNLVDIPSVEGGSRGLRGIATGPKIVRWRPGIILTYCVLAQTFPDQESYRQTALFMRQAATDWEGACGVSFEHRVELDGSDPSNDRPPPGVVFCVELHVFREQDKPIATAFFPHDPVERRRVLIDPSWFSNDGYDQVGVLRHELGHTLGFRHEQARLRDPADCNTEDTNDTVDLTEHDPRSVMHYLCGDEGAQELAITDRDRRGAQKVYGLPLASFHMVDP